MLQIQRLLVPFDFSELAEQGVLYARDLATSFGATVDVLHVVEEPAFPSFYKLGAMRIYGMVPDSEKLAWRALEKRYGPAGTDSRFEYHVTRGTADAEIVRFAEEHGSDLIVMSSHGLSGLEHMLLGSVTEKVVRSAPCSVLVVKVLHRQPSSARKKGASSEAVTLR